MKPIIIIPARGGSKGIPGKNIKSLGGKPLIQYTIEAALSLFNVEQIIVSTDSLEIKSIAEKCGLNVPFIRPDVLSGDHATSYDVIRHAMNYAENTGIEFDTVILLQPTSPFRNAHHIREAMEIYDDNLDMVVSVKESDENPYYSLFEESPDGFLNQSKTGDFTRRQDCPPVYSYNGAIYIMNAQRLREVPMNKFQKIKKYVMASADSIDLDTPLDWEIAELLMKKG